MRKQTKLVAVLSAAALLAIGASMTSFAATRGWVQEGEDWVYLDSNGDRVYNEWKRSGDYYYYLGEDGIMAKDQLIHDTTIDAYYYVDENGTRVMNAWKALPNDEGVQVGDNTPEILYYYFGSAGKANRATDDDLAIKSVNGKNYAFDTEGRMASGWQWIHVKDKKNDDALYYFGTDEEGWARTGWQQLEPGENMREDEYDDLEWYYFESNGRAVRDGSKYINGKYYAFDSFGVMRDDWYDISTAPTAASAGIAFASGNGTLANGWAFTNPKGESDADDYWFYLVTLRDGRNVKRSVPFNYYGTGAAAEAGVKAVRAKVIKNKTYIFDTDGQMMTGFVVIDGVDGVTASEEIKRLADDKAGSDSKVQIFGGGSASGDFTSDVYGAEPTDITHGINARKLETGLYYFNETAGSQNGQLMTGRTAVTKDGETFYYYFNKTGNQNTAVNYGKALTSTVKDGYLYGKDGRCLTADDGNSYALYKVTDIWEDHYETATDLDNDDHTAVQRKGIKIAGKTGAASIIDGVKPTDDVDDAYVVVSQSGRIKQSGTATIDGIRYTIKDYKVTNTKAID